MKNILALLVFVGGFAGWYLYHQKQEASESLAQARTQLADHEKVIASRRADYQSVTTALAVKKQLTERQTELRGLQSKVAALQAERAALAGERQKVLAAIRQSAVGKTISLVLVSGRNLGAVRIMKADDSGVSVATSLGVQKVLPHELPADVKQMLNY